MWKLSKRNLWVRMIKLGPFRGKICQQDYVSTEWRQDYTVGGESYWQPHSVYRTLPDSLCKLFWVGVATLLVGLVFGVGVGAALYNIGWLIYASRGLALVGAVALAGLVAFVMQWSEQRKLTAAERREAKRARKRAKDARKALQQPSFIATALWGLKHKLCPLVEITD